MENIDEILKKSYRELTDTEKLEIRDLCDSEEAFDHLKQVMMATNEFARANREHSEPSASTKKSLDDLFHKTYDQKTTSWYQNTWGALYPIDKSFFQRPLVRIAAVLLLFVLAIPLTQLNKHSEVLLATREDTPVKEIEDTGSRSDQVKIQQELNVSGSGTTIMGGPENKAALSSVSSDASFNSIPPAPQAMKEDMMVAEEGYVRDDQISTAFKKNVNTSDAFYTEKVSEAMVQSKSKVLEKNLIYSGQDNLALLDLLTPAF